MQRIEGGGYARDGPEKLVESEWERDGWWVVGGYYGLISLCVGQTRNVNSKTEKYMDFYT